MQIKKSLMAGSLAMVVIFGLAGCAKPEVAVNEKFSEEGLTLISWDDSSPVDYSDTQDWTKFSFNEFSLKMPKNFRVINLTDDQMSVELVNYPMADSQLLETAENKEMGKLSFSIRVIPNATSLDDAIGESVVAEELIVAGRRGVAVKSDNGKIVFVRSESQNKVYGFELSSEFEKFENLDDLVLSSITFYQRENL